MLETWSFAGLSGRRCCPGFPYGRVEERSGTRTTQKMGEQCNLVPPVSHQDLHIGTCRRQYCAHATGIGTSILIDIRRGCLARWIEHVIHVSFVTAINIWCPSLADLLPIPIPLPQGRRTGTIQMSTGTHSHRGSHLGPAAGLGEPSTKRATEFFFFGFFFREPRRKPRIPRWLGRIPCL